MEMKYLVRPPTIPLPRPRPRSRPLGLEIQSLCVIYVLMI